LISLNGGSVSIVDAQEFDNEKSYAEEYSFSIDNDLDDAPDFITISNESFNFSVKTPSFHYLSALTKAYSDHHQHPIRAPPFLHL